MWPFHHEVQIRDLKTTAEACRHVGVVGLQLDLIRCGLDVFVFSHSYTLLLCH